MPATHQALLVVDVQRDFCHDGALAVPGAEHVIAPLNAIIDWCVARGVPVFASRDQHPRESRHFAIHGGRWPVHCVAGTPGAAFHADLRLPEAVVLVDKGRAPDEDGYSAFEGQTHNDRSLTDALRDRGITHLVVGGVATDYCVRRSVLDACQLGFGVTVLTDAVAAVNQKDGDAERAIQAMREAGARMRGTLDIMKGRTEDAPAATDAPSPC